MSLLAAASWRRPGRGVVADDMEVRGFRPSDALGAFGVVWVVLIVKGRGGLMGARDFRGLPCGAWDSELRSRLDSCFAVIPIYLLAREPAVILDCAIIEASADETFRCRVSVGEAKEDATDDGRLADGGAIGIAAIFVDATKTPHLGGQEKYATPATEPSFFPFPAYCPLNSTPAQ